MARLGCEGKSARTMAGLANDRVGHHVRLRDGTLDAGHREHERSRRLTASHPAFRTPCPGLDRPRCCRTGYSGGPRRHLMQVNQKLPMRTAALDHGYPDRFSADPEARTDPNMPCLMASASPDSLAGPRAGRNPHVADACRPLAGGASPSATWAVQRSFPPIRHRTNPMVIFIPPPMVGPMGHDHNLLMPLVCFK